MDTRFNDFLKLQLAQEQRRRDRSLDALDRAAIEAAELLTFNQPQADLAVNQLPVLGTLVPQDSMPVFSPNGGVGIYGGQTYQVTLAVLAEYFSGGGGQGGPFYIITNYGAVPDVDATTAIQATVVAAQAAGGGVVFFPAGIWPISETITIDPSLGPVWLLGATTAGAKTALGGSVIEITTSLTNGAFNCTSTGGNPPGMRIENLTFNFINNSTGTAIVMVDGQNDRVYNCFFNDGTGGIAWLNTLQGVVRDCTFAYPAQNGVTAISIGEDVAHGASQFTTIENCIFRSLVQPTNTSTAIFVNHAQETRILNCHIDAFNIGLSCDSVGVIDTLYVDNTYIAVLNGTGNASVLLTAGSGGKIQNVYFSNTYCQFDPNVEPTGNTRGIWVSSGGQANTAADSIYFTACFVYGFPGSGLYIDSGQNITITSGQYSSNGQAVSFFPVPGFMAGGIEVNGSAQYVTLIDPNCNGRSHLGYGQQPYGMILHNGPSDVIVNGIDMSMAAVQNAYVDSTVSATTVGDVAIGDWTNTVSRTAANLSSTGLARLYGPTTIAGGAFYTGASTFRFKFGGYFSIGSGGDTATFNVLAGGNGQIILGGTYATGDTIEYTLNSHNVTYTVGATTTLTAIASGLATAINADGTDGPLVTATATLLPPGWAVVIAANNAAWELLSSLSESVTVTSVSGTATLLGGHLIQALLLYTSAGGNSGGYSGEIMLVSVSLGGHFGTATLLLNDAVVATNSIVGAFDSTINQNVEVWANTSSGSDDIENNVFTQERL